MFSNRTDRNEETIRDDVRYAVMATYALNRFAFKQTQPLLMHMASNAAIVELAPLEFAP